MDKEIVNVVISGCYDEDYIIEGIFENYDAAECAAMFIATERNLMRFEDSNIWGDADGYIEILRRPLHMVKTWTVKS